MSIDHPLTALRLAFYLGGLACFGVLPVCEHLHLPRDSLVTSASLIAGLLFFFLACRATMPHLLGWLLPYGRGLAVGGLVGALPILCLWPLLADLRRAGAREGGGRSVSPPSPRPV